ncbi:hypothetical protein ACSTLF_16245 [Vibrio parahaemolyticus]|nr:hypothetical protein [Vibrio parahaemolyticus]
MWKHNTFGDIIEEEGDFVGYVAYALYKEQKVKWIHAYKDKTGEYPTPTQIEVYFNTFHSSQDCINKFRADAERMLNEYIDFSFSEELEAYQEVVKEEEIVQAVHKPFKVAVWENLTAALIASAIIAVGSVMYWQNFEREAMESKIKILENSQQELLTEISSRPLDKSLSD